MRTLLCAALAVLLLWTPGWGFEVRSGREASLPAGQRVDDDLVISGDNVEVAGEVGGNLYAVGSTVNVRGAVEGSVAAFAQTVNWEGTAKGSVHLAGQTVSASGTTEKNLAIAGQTVTVADKTRVSRELLGAGSTVTVAGVASKGVRLAGNIVSFSGQTEGPLVLAGDRARIGAPAVVGGDLTVYGKRAPVIEPGAQIRGTTKYIVREQKAGRGRAHRRHPLLNFLGRFAVWGVLSLILLAIAPRMLTQGADTIGSRPAATFGLGLAALICGPVVAVLLMVTVIGIPAGLVLLATYLVLLALTGVFSSMFLGRKILGPRRARWGTLLLGVAVIALGAMLPYVGWLVSLLAVVFGFGAEMLWLGGALSRQRTAPPPPPPAPQPAADSPAP